MSSSNRLSIPVLNVPRPVQMSGPARPWLFAAWMAAAAVIAVVAGTVLGLLAVMELSVGGERWTQSVQAHGRLQLFGFVATLVVALAFEFLPRLNQRPAFPAWVRVSVPGMLAAGSVLMSAGQVWHEEVGYLALPGAVLFVAGAGAFALLVWRVPPPRPLKVDPQPLFVRAAAVWLVAAGALSIWSLSLADTGVVPLDHSRATVETLLRGFVMLMVLGIALRAFVGHLGLQPLAARRQLVVFGVLNASLAAWLLGQGLGPLPKAEWAARIGDAGFGAGLLLFTAWFGVLRGLRPARGRPNYALMIPVAWAGLAVYAAALVVVAVTGAADGMSLYREGAIRHIFMLGFMIPLIVGMAHIVLARFGTGGLAWPRALGIAFVLVTIAWPLRVLPALVSDPPSDAGTHVMAAAGVLLMAGLALLAAVCARTAMLMTRRQAAHTMPGVRVVVHQAQSRR